MTMDFRSLLLLLAAVSAVSGSRLSTVGGIDSELHTAAAFRVHDAGKFHVSRSHVDDLCTAAVIQQCVELAASESSRASTSRLAEVLAAEESDVVAMLEALGVEVKDDFSCRAFCEASAAHIPAILQTAAPSGPDKGCIDDACTLPTADVSQDALVHEGLKSLPTPPTPEKMDVFELSNMSAPPVLHPEDQGKLLFHAALNVVFGIFPAVDEADDESSEDGLSESLMESSAGVDAQPPGPSVAFGPRTLPRRHDQYRSNIVKAAAWISKAVRNIESGKTLVSKWFILRGDKKKVDKQVVEARRHLRKMLDSMQWLLVKKGRNQDCKTVRERGQIVGGTVAYVMKYENCGVEDFKTCGQQDRQGRHITNICEVFWVLTAPVQVGTFVHESSHHFGTRDHGYCDQVDCLRLSSKKARDNADTYTKLVEALVKLKSPEPHVKSLEPHVDCNTGCGDSTFGDWKFGTKLPRGMCGQCSVTFRHLTTCGHRKRMAQNFFQKVCCETETCLKDGKPYKGFA